MTQPFYYFLSNRFTTCYPTSLLLVIQPVYYLWFSRFTTCDSAGLLLVIHPVYYLWYNQFTTCDSAVLLLVTKPFLQLWPSRFTCFYLTDFTACDPTTWLLVTQSCANDKYVCAVKQFQGQHLLSKQDCFCAERTLTWRLMHSLVRWFVFPFIYFSIVDFAPTHGKVLAEPTSKECPDLRLRY